MHMMDPDIRGHTVKAQIRHQLGRIGRDLLHRQYRIAPDHRLQMQTGETGRLRLGTETIQCLPCGRDRAETIHQPGQVINGKIRFALQLPIGRMREIGLDDVIAHPVKGRG